MRTRELRPHINYLYKEFVLVLLWWALIASSTAGLAYLIGLDVAGRLEARNALLILLGVNVLWLAPILALLPAYYRSLVYTIAEDEIIVEAGVITKSVKHVPFRTITNLKVSRGPFDRLFGIGSLDVQTAGMSGQTGAEEKLAGLAEVSKVYEEVAGVLRRFRGSMAPTQAETEADAPALPSAVEILAELRAIRAALESR